ncbi:alanyl-tRNA synthetase [Candidatus Acidianus copahuensis]|uniref:Alanine--tRNA ligase n=1 Tax=Candidatus Acidianus copahuensis TaxID=1160895 RepID=A0A031LQA8_9CREN|nr:alanine--tRNA ligase [Candidatus Acidianus copahuensis]EZQ06915.1 alanyl-tRNA synthetase [Candidatus Acidianus copahuensis]
MKVSEEEYRLKFFKDNGYLRKECKVCRTPFWTTEPNRDNCADIPCSDYYFLDSNISKLNWSVSEARKRFLGFFNKHGHEIIPPKPVLARWRNDIYLTIASIVDFQPHVTSGIVPPPANPLVISQPCIRLEDVDNVGITFGRHLTTFEMGGHHAFNYPDKFIYWKDETLELSKEFFVEEMKIPEEMLNFKESWWEGGGNAGPSFEVTVGGLELATLVFMQYSILNGEYIPLKLKVVDTGYGIERLAWFTQKTPTSFHAIYGNLVYTFFRKLGQQYVDEEMLKHAARLAGRIDTDKPETIELHRLEVAKTLNMDAEVVKEELTRAARVFQVLDHTKTIGLMLADGLVPSNSGEGYLGRLLIRRALRVIKLLGSNVRLIDLMKDQIDFWKEDFPEMLRNKDYILDAVEYEEEKFQEIIQRVPSIISTISKKKGKIEEEELIKIYDTNGIPPDILSEELKKRDGIQLDIPSNFYALVARRHQTAPLKAEKEKAKLPSEIIKFAKNFRPTEKLYYKDQYLRDFDAEILGVKDNFVILDRTAFYPEGGGQLGDKGKIIVNGKEYDVLDTQVSSDVIVHVLETANGLKPGDKVHAEIDWQRRYRLMKHHTVTHVILGAAKKLLGDHVWQAGAEKTPDKGRLDITHYKMLTEEEIRKIEDISNYIINDRRPVRAFEMGRVEAELKFGVSIYEGGVPEKANIRLLEIKDWDIEGCGGTHVSNTSEIGGVKIINVEKIQEGVIRLEYVAGDVVSKYARELEERINDVAKTLGTSSEELNKRVHRFTQEIKEKEDLVLTLKRYYIENTLAELKAENIDSIRFYSIINPLDQDSSKEIMRRLTSDNKTVAISLMKDKNSIIVDIATSKDIKVDSIIDNLRKLGGKGGGKGTFGSIRFNEMKIEDILDAIKKGLKGSI